MKPRSMFHHPCERVWCDWMISQAGARIRSCCPVTVSFKVQKSVRVDSHPMLFLGSELWTSSDPWPVEFLDEFCGIYRKTESGTLQSRTIMCDFNQNSPNAHALTVVHTPWWLFRCALASLPGWLWSLARVSLSVLSFLSCFIGCMANFF